MSDMTASDSANLIYSATPSMSSLAF